jgi:hypothetical protein
MTAYSPDYETSRARFRSAAIALGATLEAWPIAARGPNGRELTIDVATTGPADAARWLVLSSGVHGVEGYFGAAVQAQLLERRLPGRPLPEGAAVLLIHAVNPFGMAWRRRVNEDNVDLNRNFLRAGERYEGSPEGYAALNGMLNPARAPRRVSAFLPRAAFAVARHGMPALKNAVAGGQYDFPKGLFFGGSGPTESHRLLASGLPRLLGHARRVLHLDMHTGLGAYGTYKLFVDHAWGSPGQQALASQFGDAVEPWEPKQGTSYTIRGGLGTWCKATMPTVDYDVLAAEFGTVSALQVAAALSRENRAWWHVPRDSARSDAERRRLAAIFVPDDVGWRERCLAQALHLVDRALDQLAR